MFMKSAKTATTAVAALVAAVLVSACGGGGGGGIDYGYGAWYDVYGNQCGYSPGPGCNFYSNGLKIIDIEDPYYSPFNLGYDALWKYTDSYGFTKYYDGWAWLSTTGILYDAYGNALNETDSQGRDFSADVATKEKNVVTSAGEYFAAKYHLETQEGIRVARLMNEYAEIGKSRARTDADLADFSQRLYGVDFNKVKGALAEAMKGGDKSKDALNEVIGEAADNWKTSPETMKEILKTWYGKQAAGIL